MVIHCHIKRWNKKITFGKQTWENFFVTHIKLTLNINLPILFLYIVKEVPFHLQCI